MRVIRSVRGERPERFHVSRFGFRPRMASPRAALAGGSNVLAPSNVGGGDRSFERPSNNGLEPSRPTVRCYPVATTRGSNRTLAGQEIHR